MPTYKLTYFNWTGLAEVSRLLFSLAEVPFEDIRIEKDEYFPTLSPEWKAKLPWEQVPLLEVDGLKLAQSGAINRFLARRFNLYGKDEFEWAKTDELVDAIMEFAKEFLKIVLETDETKKKAILKNCVEVVGPKYLSKFNKIIEANGGTSLVGNGFTWADVYLCHFVPYMEAFYNLKFPKDYPAVQKLVDKFHADPRIKKWHANAPRVPEFSAEIFADELKKKLTVK